MQNFTKAYQDIMTLWKESEISGGVVGIIGEGGIGKSFLAETVISDIADEAFIVQIKGQPTECAPYSALFNGVIHSITRRKIIEEYALDALKKYVRIIPGIGSYIPEGLIKSKSDIKNIVLSKSGLSEELSVAAKTIDLISELSSQKRVVIYCDDAQWIDSETWSFVAELDSVRRKRGWFVLYSINNKVPSRSELYLNLTEHWASKNHEEGYLTIHPERWGRNNVCQLCESILKRKVCFDDKNLDILIKYSSGIPRYTRSSLKLLLENKLIFLENEKYTDSGTWDDPVILDKLKESLENNLKDLYKKIPESQDVLEIASVIGQEFKDGDIDGVLDSKNSKTVLDSVENLNEYVKYIFGDKNWAFDHNLVHFAIYKSLGEDTPRYHKVVADYFSKKGGPPLAIAYHYEKAGMIHKSLFYRIEEAAELLKNSLFRQAYNQLEKIHPYIQIHKMELSDDTLYIYKITKIKSLYYMGRYKESIQFIMKNIKDTKNEKHVSDFKRWAGKCYLNLDTLSDFKLSIDYLKAAATTYKAANLFDDLGETYSDLVIAYAHNNQFEKAKTCFEKADKIFYKTKNREGSYRLQRKNIIFMDSEISVPVQLAVADSFRQLNMPHERIMALTNAATKMLYQNKIEEAEEELKEALRQSQDIDFFGWAHIHNNLAIISAIKGKLDEALIHISEAKKFRVRNIESYIIDVNESVIHASIKVSQETGEELRKIAKRAVRIGEKVLIYPAYLNYARFLLDVKRYDECIKLLRKIRPLDSTYSDYEYKNKRWYGIYEEALINSKQPKSLDDFRSKYENIKVKKSGCYWDFSYSFIDLQFWSD